MTAAFVVATALLPASAKAAEAASLRAPVLLTGTVARDGLPAGGATVSVRAWPNTAVTSRLRQGERVHFLSLGTARTASNGAFTVAANLSSLPAAYRGEAGVDLDITAGDATWQVPYSITAVPVDGGWSTASDELSGKREPASVHFDIGRHPAVSEAHTVSTPIKGSRGLSPAVNATAPEAVRRVATPVGGCYTSAGSWHYGLNEWFMDAFAYSGATATVQQETGATHSLGVGIGYSDGHWGGNGTSTIGSSSSGSATRSGIYNDEVFNKINYRDFYTSAPCPYTNRRPQSVYAFLTGYIYTPHQTYRYCAHYTGGQVQRNTGTDYTFTGGMDLLAIHVNAQSGYTAASRIWWNITAPTWFCGLDAVGPFSSRISEARAG